MTDPAVNLECFAPFYTHAAPWQAFKDGLAPAARRAIAPQSREAVLHRMWEAVLATVEGHSYRSLIAAFHAFREAQGLPADLNSNRALTLYTRHLAHDGSADVLAEYPVLARRLAGVTEQMRQAAHELLTGYTQDLPRLTEAFGIEPSDLISAVQTSGSDPHNNNRRVWFVTLTSGTRLVYKPRPLTGDEFARDLYRAVGPGLTHSLEPCAPASLTCADHGWQLFTAPRPMRTPAEADRYFYRFGALTCLFSAIGATDLHDENLLACGEYPTVVDTETLLRADAGVDNDTLPNALINHMKSSVTSTMMLPMMNPDSVFDIMLSAIGVLGAQESQIKNPKVVDDETDAIRVVWENYSHQHTINVPRLQEKDLPVTEFFPQMMHGYRDMLAVLGTGAVEEVLDRYGSMVMRSVMRSTEVYSRFLDASTHPKYLKKQEDLDRLFTHLRRFHQKLRPDQAEFLQRQEAAGLDNGDIPYFMVRSDQLHLATYTGQHDTFYRTAAIDFAKLGVSMAKRQHERYHQFLVEECLGDLAVLPQGLSRDSIFRAALDGTAPGEWGHKIADIVADLAVTVDGRTGWLGGIGPDRGAATVTPGNFVTFHDMGGIARMYAQAARADRRHAPMRDAAHAGLTELWEAYPQVLDNVPESVFSGRASQLLAHAESGGDAWLKDLLAAIAERGEQREQDVSNGPAGLLLLLLARMRRGGRTYDPALVEELRQLALAPGAAPTGAPMELAHGPLGLAWAKARTAAVLDEPALAEEAADWLAAHLDGYTPALTGWCKGAAGVLLAGSEIAQAAGRLDWFTERAVPGLVQAATELPAAPVELSVCHGSSGVVQALLYTARVTGDESLVKSAGQYQHEVLELARRHGFYVGARGRTSTLGYMTGWAGVADTDLMLTDHGAALGIPTALSC
ncbi:type 2 lanthipeptide synthetase LanM [Streptomyces sp. NPDC052000]|uniref:type 2 lanthipeptide synthetase LanM n=1 Tax=Streptomyces sp. NPDC052000 TaxID=3155676 RepID=UPI00344EFF4B